MTARIEYYSLGGTIASVHRDEPGAVPSLDAADLLAGLAGLDDLDVRPHAFRRMPSMELTLPVIAELVAAMRAAAEDGATGFVVSQGTDDIEETSFLIDLLWERDEPVVVTGAMRSPSLPGADGPANLVAAMRTAASPEARGLGVVVAMADELHAARFVQKRHTSAPGAFRSPAAGPLGWVTESRPRIALWPVRTPSFSVPATTPTPRVALVRIGFGDDGALLRLVASGSGDTAFDGVVVEGMGGGHVPSAGLDAVDALLARVPVVLASRTGAGEVLTASYRYPGSEIDLLARGCVSAGPLDGLKARLLLTVALAAGADPRQSFEAISSAS